MTEQRMSTNQADLGKKKGGQQQQQPTMMMKKSVENTVFVRFVPSIDALRRHHVEELFSEIGPIKKSAVIHAQDKSYGFVKYTTHQDAELAAIQMNHRTIKLGISGTPTIQVKVELAKQAGQHNKSSSTSSQPRKDADEDNDKQQKNENDKQGKHHDSSVINNNSNKKSNRLIIRNLSFYAKEKDIRTVLESKYGKLVEVHIPKVGNTHRGFAFITFESKNSVQKCLQDSNYNTNNNGIVIKDRVVSISKSLQKSAYLNEKTSNRNNKDKYKNQNEEDIRAKERENKETEMTDGEDEDSEKEEDEDADGDSKKDDATEESSDDDNDSINDADNDNDDHDKGNKKSKTQQKQKEERDMTAVGERRCIFVRNLPFDVTRHDLFELFRSYGVITAVYLVKQKSTGLPVGTAFVSFAKPEQVTKILRQSSNMNDEEVEGIAEDISNDNNNTAKFTSQRDTAASIKAEGKHVTSDNVSGGSNFILKGRTLLIDLAVDKETATTLATTADDNVKGQDRRNLYLLTEGRVENDESTGNMEWDNIPESDKFKRQAAWSDKNTKLKSPLFFINPVRLSIRNLAKHVTETQLKKLCAEAVVDGMKSNLVSTQDQINHWRATGSLSTREILARIQQAEQEQHLGTGDEESASGKNNRHDAFLLPIFDENNIKRYIPSVYISRDVVPNQPKSKAAEAPSRGFGFIEFTHHLHALACLRQLNNNPTYSKEYAAGGKKAANDTTIRRKKKPKTNKGAARNNNDGIDNGAVKIPRLILDFAVENKAKAKQQLEHRTQQQTNILKQREEVKTKKLDNNFQDDATNNKKKKKKSRGAVQRERKRKQRELKAEQGETSDDDRINKALAHEDKDTDFAPTTKHSSPLKAEERHRKQPVKEMKPLKKKAKVDESEERFAKLVDSYKEQFMTVARKEKPSDLEGLAASTTEKVTSNDKSLSNKRWFE